MSGTGGRGKGERGKGAGAGGGAGPAAGAEAAAPYRATTRGIRVSVTPEFLAERSDPEAHRFVWAYTIEIANESPIEVQLKRRHWRITDARGRVEEVRGAGVVGEEPVLAPGEAFRYTSGCPLTTPQGIMEGAFEMISEAGESFPVAVPAFSLDSPHARAAVH